MLNESAYRDTYATVNPLQCVFERAILRRCCGCQHSVRRYIAEREAAGCLDIEAHALCAELKKTMRHAALFTLKLTHPDEPLPHGKELKLQCGGLQGVAGLTEGVALVEVADIHAALAAAINRFGSIQQLPYQEIIQSIRAYEPRSHRKKK